MNKQDRNKHNQFRNWFPSQADWLKWNTDGSRRTTKLSTNIRIVCRDTYSRLLYNRGKSIGDCLILQTLWPFTRLLLILFRQSILRTS